MKSPGDRRSFLEGPEVQDENAARSVIGMDDKDLTWVERTERDPSLAAFRRSGSCTRP